MKACLAHMSTEAPLVNSDDAQSRVKRDSGWYEASVGLLMRWLSCFTSEVV